MSANSVLVLLDDDSEWGEESNVIAYWTRRDIPSNQVSIPMKVEEVALQIKKEYLSWVCDLGQFKMGTQSLISYLKLFDNFSFWWTTFLAEKSLYKYAALYDVFKIRVATFST